MMISRQRGGGSLLRDTEEGGWRWALLLRLPLLPQPLEGRADRCKAGANMTGLRHCWLRLPHVKGFHICTIARKIHHDMHSVDLWEHAGAHLQAIRKHRRAHLQACAQPRPHHTMMPRPLPPPWAVGTPQTSICSLCSRRSPRGVQSCRRVRGAGAEPVLRMCRNFTVCRSQEARRTG